MCFIVHTKRKESNPAERAECRGMWAGGGRESPAPAPQLGKALPGQPPPGHRALSLYCKSNFEPICRHLKSSPIFLLNFCIPTSLRPMGAWGLCPWVLLPSPSTEDGAMYTVGAQILRPLSAELPIFDSFKKQSHGLESSLPVWCRHSSVFVPQGASSKRLWPLPPMSPGTERPQSTGCLGL